MPVDQCVPGRRRRAARPVNRYLAGSDQFLAAANKWNRRSRDDRRHASILEQRRGEICDPRFRRTRHHGGRPSEGDANEAVSEALKRGAGLLIPCGSSASVAAKRQTSTKADITDWLLRPTTGNPLFESKANIQNSARRDGRTHQKNGYYYRASPLIDIRFRGSPHA
jgi:hypothetical protein